MKLLSGLLAVLAALFCASARGGEPGEDRQARTWIEKALLGKTVAAPAAGLEVRRQDHETLHVNQSVLKTPLKIGNKPFVRGLGTHATSRIVVRLPSPGRRFEAQAGVDNNHDTAGKKGSVVFAVEVAGKEVSRTGLCRQIKGRVIYLRQPAPSITDLGLGSLRPRRVR